MSTQTQTHDEIRAEIRAENERFEAGLAEFDAYIAECLAQTIANKPDFDREGAEEVIRQAHELMHAHHEAKIAELEAKIQVTKDELIERAQRAGDALNAEYQRREAHIFEIFETGNPDGVTVEQIHAEYAPRIAELDNAYGLAMRAVMDFNA